MTFWNGLPSSASSLELSDKASELSNDMSSSSVPLSLSSEDSEDSEDPDDSEDCSAVWAGFS